MKNKLKLSEKFIIKGVSYEVIGIDTYILVNIYGKKRAWISYTLSDDSKNKTWISYQDKGNYFIQWKLITKEQFNRYTTKQLDLELTGLAEVSIEGNPGYSTPFADILWFTDKFSDYDFLGVERFLQIYEDRIRPEITYYNAGKILYEKLS